MRPPPLTPLPRSRCPTRPPPLTPPPRFRCPMLSKTMRQVRLQVTLRVPMALRLCRPTQASAHHQTRPYPPILGLRTWPISRFKVLTFRGQQLAAMAWRSFLSSATTATRIVATAARPPATLSWAGSATARPASARRPSVATATSKAPRAATMATPNPSIAARRPARTSPSAGHPPARSAPARPCAATASRSAGSRSATTVTCSTTTAAPRTARSSQATPAGPATTIPPRTSISRSWHGTSSGTTRAPVRPPDIPISEPTAATTA